MTESLKISGSVLDLGTSVVVTISELKFEFSDFWFQAQLLLNWIQKMSYTNQCSEFIINQT